jgi:phosphatidylinositol-4-phosphate 3-kinase
MFDVTYDKSMVFYSLLNTSIHMGRSHIKQVAEKRRVEIQNFLNTLFQMAPEVSHSDLVYTFFHPLLRDQQEASIEDSKLKGKYFNFPIFPKSYRM